MLTEYNWGKNEPADGESAGIGNYLRELINQGYKIQGQNLNYKYLFRFRTINLRWFKLL